MLFFSIVKFVSSYTTNEIVLYMKVRLFETCKFAVPFTACLTHLLRIPSFTFSLLQWLTVKQDSSHTIGVEFGSKIVTIGGKQVKLQIWDTVI